MKKSLKLSVLAAALLASPAFADTKVEEKVYEPPKCAAPIASVVVGKFSCKAASCQGQSSLAMFMRAAGGGGSNGAVDSLGSSMTDMLTTVLKSTGCFDIQEREAMDELAKELALVGKKVEVQQADYMITGSITSIDLSSDTASLGGGFIPLLGLINITTKKADVGLDIKLIDVNRAKVLEAKTFAANNETTSAGFGAVGWGGGGLLAGGFSSFKNTPLEPLIRDVLAQTTQFAISKIGSHKSPPVASVVVPLAAAIPVVVSATPSITPLVAPN